MPNYIYSRGNKTIEVFQSMDGEHSSYVDEKGLEWKRVYTSPNAQIINKIDPHNPKEFVHATSKNGFAGKGSFGDLLDRSEELSQERKKTNDFGLDPIKENKFKKYSEKRKNRIHPNQNIEGNTEI